MQSYYVRFMRLLNEFKGRANNSTVYQESAFLYFRASFQQVIRKAIIVV